MNEEQLKFFNEVIRPRLIQMAIDGDSALSDLNELSSAHFDEDAKEFNSSEESYRAKCINNLSHYVSEDDLEAAFDRLITTDEYTDADDVVLMWEPLSYRYSVRDLLRMIGA
jgi:hypothetical protein